MDLKKEGKEKKRLEKDEEDVWKEVEKKRKMNDRRREK